MIQIINKTGTIIKEQINLGNIDNLNIDDLFKDNTSKKMKNNNYPNWLVPTYIAKKLKKIGFNEPCLVENVETHSEDYNFINFEEEMCSEVSVQLEDVVFIKNEYLEDNLGLYKDLILKTAIPTWEQVFEWFREKGFDSYIGLENLPYPNEGIYYYFEISKPNLYRINQLDWQGEFDDYNEAREALVKVLIQTYKSEQL